MSEKSTKMTDVYAEFADKQPLNEKLIEELANKVVEIERTSLDQSLRISKTIQKIDKLIREAVRNEWEEAFK